MTGHRMLSLGAAALLLCLPAIGAAAAPPADLIVLGAAIATLDPARPEATALAVRGDRIVAVGDDDTVAALAGPNTQRLEVRGRRVIPGFIEGHGHFMSLGETLGMLDLRGASDWETMVSMVRDAAAKAPPGGWVRGHGWHQEKWRSVPSDAIEGVPVNALLNAAAPRNPVYLEHASGHGVLANDAALALAGIDSRTPDPAGGHIARDATGKPGGWLVDTAAAPVFAAYERARVARPAAEQHSELVAQVRRAGREALSKGVTTFHDAGAPFAVIDLYRELAGRGELPVRLYAMVGSESNESLERNLARYRMTGHGNHFLTVRAIKRMADGALGSRSALLLEPYTDEPTNSGLRIDGLDVLARTAELAATNGYQLNTHAIGDRANRDVLDLYEREQRAHPAVRGLRWRIEHAQHLHPDDVPRFAKLGVIASMQGVHAVSDGPWVPKRLGEPRAGERTYVWRSLWDAGVVVVNGTDVPVEDVDPLASFRASVTREMADGQRFHPEQCLTRQEALLSYTRNTAYAAFEEDDKGSLAPGKLADFVVLDRDILHVPDAELAQARVLTTVLGGRVVYTREPAGNR